MAFEDWEPVIGLEIHAQLKTKSKMFSPEKAEFSNSENDQIHPVSFGLPGTLPVLNKQVLYWAIKAAKAFSADIQKQSVFSRKNYFYPDLPKGYQISQFDKPYSLNGVVKYYVKDEVQEIHLERIHMEEDAGRSLHTGKETLVNFNRAGVPLLEIVTRPEIKDPISAGACVRAIRRTLRYLEVCDGNLEEGSLRCDCNVSVRKRGDSQLGTKVELKNINSFRFIEKALQYEIKRQIQCLESGTSIQQETRLYNPTKNQTFSMRSKEESSDYRYFPEPDLLPVTWDLKKIKTISLPELPFEKSQRFQKEYQLTAEQSEQLVEDQDLCDYFESLAKETKNSSASYHWITGEVQAHLKRYHQSIREAPSHKELKKLIDLVNQNVLSVTMAKEVLKVAWSEKQLVEEIIKQKNLKLISDEKTLKGLVQKILSQYPKQVSQYREGKTKVFGFFVGQVMKDTKGQAHPEKLSKIIKESLKEE